MISAHAILTGGDQVAPFSFKLESAPSTAAERTLRGFHVNYVEFDSHLLVWVAAVVYTQSDEDPASFHSTAIDLTDMRIIGPDQYSGILSALSADSELIMA